MRINDLSPRSVAEREIVSPVDNDCTCKIIARANVHFVRTIYLSVNLVRTLAYSQEAYELYINARNSRVRYNEFCSLSLIYLSQTLQIIIQPSGSFLFVTKPSGFGIFNIIKFLYYKSEKE